METPDIGRIAEIDRSERVSKSYVCDDGDLREIAVDWNVPRWFSEGEGDHSVRGNINDWKPYLEEKDGVMYGAFDEDLLVGFLIFRPHLTEGMDQLAVLHVSRDYRRQGIATRLARIACELALESGARELYVSATPTESAVGFYRSQGFELAEEVNRDLYALEPEDIHMIKKL
jgi:ribosomal protein S18 acetylase RimI-like enzyme